MITPSALTRRRRLIRATAPPNKTRAAGPAVQLARLAIPRDSDTPRVGISFRSKLDAGTAIFTAIPLINADATFTPTISIVPPFER
jgi:hypothetical protein